MKKGSKKPVSKKNFNKNKGKTFIIDPEVLGDTKDLIFNQKLLEYDDMIELFKKADDLIEQQIESLYRISKFPELYFCTIISKTSVNTLYGRIVFEKNEIPEEKVNDYYTNQTISFLERGMKYLNACTLKESYPLDTIFNILRDVNFIRSILEEILEDFLWFTKDYLKLLRIYIKEYQKENKDENRLSLINKKLFEIEQFVDVDRNNLYHVILEIKENKKEYIKIRNKIISPYLRVAYKEAKAKSNNNSDKFIENLQNGSLGLIRAFSCYSKLKKVGFSYYAKMWINQAIHYWMKENSSLIKIPAIVWHNIFFLEKIKNRLGIDSDILLESEELAKVSEVTGLSEYKLNDICTNLLYTRPSSLDFYLDDNEKTNMSDVLVVDTEEKNNEIDMKNYANDIFDKLSAKNALILSLKYGFLDLITCKNNLKEEDIIKERLNQFAGSLVRNVP